jgi:hypothetical protein
MESTTSLSSLTSPFEMVISTDPNSGLIPDAIANLPNLYSIRTQSSRFHDDDAQLTVDELNDLLERDVQGRIMRVGDSIAAELFPDEAFNFPINDQFVNNFCGTFINAGKLLDTKKFGTEKKTANFLNQMVTTIACFLDTTEKTHLKPLHYFCSSSATKSPEGSSPSKVKPDILIVPLIDGHLQQESLTWKHVYAIIEHTQEATFPVRMARTTRVKSFTAFCHQPERDFLPLICITKNHFHVIVTDHTGQIETDPIPFNRTSSTLIFIRLVMGLAFLPISRLGMDSTMIRHAPQGKKGKTLSEAFAPFRAWSESGDEPKPTIKLFLPDTPTVPTVPTTSSTASPKPPTIVEPTFIDDDVDSDSGIVRISINNESYKVVRLLFRSQTLVGRATKAFLVKLPTGGLGVLKDSWIPIVRASEANFLKDLHIPFGPKLLDHCVLGNTATFRKHPSISSLFPDSRMPFREKRRILTCPAGVHISNFFCLWELMVALLDVVIGMINFIFLFTTLLTLTYFLAISYLESRQMVHRDISYTNIILRESVRESVTIGRSDSDSSDKLKIREGLISSLDLSGIMELRQSLECREGLLIDFDYGGSLTDQKGIEGEEGDKNDETIKAQHVISSFRPQEPSGSRTVCFSQFQDFLQTLINYAGDSSFYGSGRTFK